MNSGFGEEAMKLELTRRLGNLSVSDVAMKPPSGQIIYWEIPKGMLSCLAMKDGILDDSVWSMHSNTRAS
jgi:hypothetical protein